MKLSSRANSISTLEQSVMSGLHFWEEPPEFDNDDDQNHHNDNNDDEGDDVPYSKQDADNIKLKNRLAEDVVKKMAEEKKYRI
jgi:hypothetical protein